MSLKIIFFDMNKSFISSYQNVLQNNMSNTKFIHTDLDTLIKQNPFINAIVSPANSYGFMNGGIDRDINKIMNNIEIDVKQRINQIGNYDSRGDRFLPVGKCEVVTKSNMHLFVAPTMMMPSKIKNGELNVMMAFYAILQKAFNMTQNGVHIVLACPCLGTGVGQMDPYESAKQILTAWNYFCERKN